MGRTLDAFLRIFQGIKLGPGVLGSTAPVNIAGLFVILGLVYFLRNEPLFALGSSVLVLLYLIYVNERAFRYALKDPVSAILGGGELVQVYRDQMAAKDKRVVSHDPPVIGSSAKLIEGKRK